MEIKRIFINTGAPPQLARRYTASDKCKITLGKAALAGHYLVEVPERSISIPYHQVAMAEIDWSENSATGALARNLEKQSS